MIAAFVVSLSLFLPIQLLVPWHDRQWWILSTLLRVAPVIAAFIGLLLYGLASTWQGRGKGREKAVKHIEMAARPAPLASHLSPLLLGGALGILIAGVAAAAYATVPARLRTPAEDWTPQDWQRHLADVISRPGIAPETLARLEQKLGRWYVSTDPRMAAEHYRRAAACEPHSAEFCAGLGGCFIELDCINDAVEQWERALELEPRWVEIHHRLAAALAAGGRTDGAIEHLRRVIALNPRHAVAENDLGAVLARSQRLDEAIAHYRKALEIKPDYAEARNNLGAALAGCGRLEEAIGQYRKALEISPDYAEAHNDLGAALAGCGRLEEAIGQYRKALEIRPDYAEARNNLGAALAGCGRLDEAIAQYRKVLDVRPDHAEAHYNLGLALAGRGQTAEAIDHYRKAVQLKPDYVMALNDLAWQRATCRQASLRNGRAAIDLARARSAFPAAGRRNCSIRWPRPMPRRECSPRPPRRSPRRWTWPGKRTSRPWWKR